ncbi:MCE family protein [Saccharothrix yanglingensis]|uniref:ABC transporter substrate-binding protein n=1 Tax=Saccharothrix yanglingensis TaxID=659496 RepID=A0ABU0XAR1_9PSEU|nr:MCE family protein [Saccharothrix yanglingensis]MDQ2589222.1 ABC transporter substrate-binding protein [Saccharothrix yanglingensis]
MFVRTRNHRRVVVGLAQALVLVLVAVVAAWWVFLRPAATRVTAYFTAAVGVYEGSDVRVLGVRVGQVVGVLPEGGSVRVDLELDHGVDVPADARAVVVSPTIVADRYVQLTPVYTGGDRMAPGAVITSARTAGTVELDELYASLDSLLTALGPNGANRQGALSDLLRTGAANLDGTGGPLGESIRQLADAARTLAGSREDLFGTVDNLQAFTGVLAADDEQVGRLADQLADVSGFFAAERDDLGTALGELAGALEQVRTFVRDNRERVRSGVDDLAVLTGSLVRQQQSLAEVLDVAPVALHNVVGAYDPATGTLNARANLNEFVADLLSVPGGAR